MVNDKISIVVPAYNVQKYIGRCLDSILNQTYDNCEVIVVDDGSTDDTAHIIRNYCLQDDRVKVVSHEKNMGLFRARMSGVKEATGKYIGFVDSDDYVSEDYFRTLVYRASETNSDIVVGKLVQEDEKGYRWVQKVYDDFDFGIIEGKEIVKRYWEQEGMLFIWHTIWNKLYSADLWKESYGTLDRLTNHLVMAEDFVFSSVLFSHAKRLSSVNYGTYFYFRNENASTSLNNNFSKFHKNIADLCVAFKFVGDYIKAFGFSEEIIEHFSKWESLYRYFWEENVKNSGLNSKKKKDLLSILRENFSSARITNVPNYFYAVSTKFDDRYNLLVKTICSEKIEVVSFDIFDTALVRPFYKPEDLFQVLEDSIRDIIPSDICKRFAEARISAEKRIRKEIEAGLASFEEVSLLSIYELLAHELNIEHSVVETIMKTEIALERKYLRKRRSIYNLYQLAIHLGKKVVFTSDMYLDKNSISIFLKDNGYVEWDEIYVSSELNSTKRTGKLYSYLLRNIHVDGKKVLHIGDNWETDVVNARNSGVNAAFYAKTLDCLLYNIGDIKTTNAFTGYKGRKGSRINYERALDFLGTRCALAEVANKIYDMPYISYDEWSETNASPQFLGYGAMGMHLLGFIKWINDTARKSNYKKLVFVARDGYLPLQGFNIFNRYGIGLDYEYTYLYTSRKAAVPCGVRTLTDIYALYSVFGNGKTTKGDILKRLSPLLADENTHIAEFESKEIITSYDSYRNFVDNCIANLFDAEKANKFNEAVKSYFLSEVGDKAAIVDIGYSGRTNEMIYVTSGLVTDSFFVHTNSDECKRRENLIGFSVHTFYDYTPAITGSQRELLFSQNSPSCVGYSLSEGTVEPVFEIMTYDYARSYLLSEVQNKSLEFIDDFCNDFHDIFHILNMRNIDMSLPWEYVLSQLKDDDLHLFDCIQFEDDMWAGGTVALSEQWKEFKNYHCFTPEKTTLVDKWDVYTTYKFDERNIIVRALFWLLFDRHYFSDRVKRLFVRNIGKK